MKLNHILSLAIGLLFMACQNDAPYDSLCNPCEPNYLPEIACETAALLDTTQWQMVSTRKQDALEIVSESIEGNILTLEVRYTGGCEFHCFRLLWSGDIIKTHPEKIAMLLTHDANNDACEALIRQRLQFDLSMIHDYYDSLALLSSNYVFVQAFNEHDETAWLEFSLQ